MSGGGQIIGLTETIRALTGLGPGITTATHLGMARGVAGGASIVRGRASGRPGPRNITGDYRRTITSATEVQGSRVLGQIGSNAAQARRLEYGFMGMTDVLGRLFHQPPYPHFGPSQAEVAKLVVDQIGLAVKASVGS